MKTEDEWINDGGGEAVADYFYVGEEHEEAMDERSVLFEYNHYDREH